MFPTLDEASQALLSANHYKIEIFESDYSHVLYRFKGVDKLLLIQIFIFPHLQAQF